MFKTIIIAEAGVNHNGDIELAKKLIDVASDSGADYIKFQTFKTELNLSIDAPKAEYQIKNTGEDISQYEMLKMLELSFEDFITLKKYADSKNIKFLSTAFDFPSIDFINELGVDYFKIPSGEITNKPYLKYIASKGKKIILSTGMANLNEIKEALSILEKSGTAKNKITVLHCNTEYPTPMEDVNLKAMLHIKKELNVNVGYSDHTLGIEVPIAAVALGASIIEKHFTLDKNLKGPDHSASLDPNELKSMITSIRNIEKALSGNGIKEPSKSEKKNLYIARKSIFFNQDVLKGTVIKLEMLDFKRPGYGISPMEIDNVIGKKVTKDFKKGEILNWESIK